MTKQERLLLVRERIKLQLDALDSVFLLEEDIFEDEHLDLDNTRGYFTTEEA